MNCRLPKTSFTNPKGCIKQEQQRFNTLLEIINDYIRKHRKYADEEMDFFRRCPNLPTAIEHAALSKLPNGKRHPHQYRRLHRALAQAERNLQAIPSELRRCRSFNELYLGIKKAIGYIHDIGPLTIYDVAHRIGVYLKLEPERVYLHAGTADGAKALRLNYRRESLDVDELPKVFRRLKPSEIEDCLCIYKDYLLGIHT